MYRAVLPVQQHYYCPPAGTQISYQGSDAGQSFSWRETLPDVMTITAAVIISADEDEMTRLMTRKERFQTRFAHYPAAVQDLLQALSSDNIHEGRVRDVDAVPTVWSDGPVALVGDAAHAMTPNMGQGANMGLEDVCVLVHGLVPLLFNMSDNTATTTTTSTPSHDIARAL